MSDDSENDLLRISLAYYYIRRLRLGRLVHGLKRQQHITRELLSDHDEESVHERSEFKLQRIERVSPPKLVRNRFHLKRIWLKHWGKIIYASAGSGSVSHTVLYSSI